MLILCRGGRAVLLLVLSLPYVPAAALSLPPPTGVLSLLVWEGVVHIHQLLKYDHKRKMNLHGIPNMGQHSLSHCRVRQTGHSRFTCSQY